MDEINKRVDQAHRRLVIEEWIHRVVRCVFAALCVAAVAVAVPKLFVTPALPEAWDAAWLGGAVGVGLLAATVWSLASRRDRLEAAVEIDRRYGLRERVASSLTLGEEDLASAAGRALATDAERAVARVEVGERFGLSAGRRAWAPLVPAAIALLLVAFVGNRTAQSGVDPKAQAATAEEVKQAVEAARKRLEMRKKEAEKKGLNDASGLLKEIEKSAEELAKKTPESTAKTAVKLNDLTKQLEERRRKLGGGESLRDQMNQMEDLGRGPAEKMAEAMKAGDWQKALDEVAKLQKQLAKGELSKEQAEHLAEQLGKMQKKLADGAKQQQQQKKEVERQLAEAQRKGDLNQAAKLQQKLDQMKQQGPAQQQMQQMAQQMQKAQQAMQQGDAQKAAEAMQNMADQMQQMQQQMDAMEMLDGAMTDIQMAKQAMGLECEACKPGGMAAANKPGNKPGKGPGMGEGQGEGPRPDEENPTNFRDTRVKQNVGRGASTFGGLVKGPSIKGDVVESIKTELSTDTASPADPLASERLPRAHREHAEEYFRRLREEL